MATERSNQRHPMGGQRAAPIGTDTLHHRSAWDFCVELEQAGKRFDIDGAGNCEPRPAHDEATLAAFNRALQEAVAAEFGGADGL